MPRWLKHPGTGLLVLEALKRDDSAPPLEDIMTKEEVEDVLDQLELAEQKEPSIERVREGTSRRKEERARRHTATAALMLREKLEISELG